MALKHGVDQRIEHDIFNALLNVEDLGWSSYPESPTSVMGDGDDDDNDDDDEDNAHDDEGGG